MDGGVAYPVASPIDDRVVFSSPFTGQGVFWVHAAGGRGPELLPGTKWSAGYFLALSWSPDGSRLCGPVVSDSGRAAGVGVYDLHTHTLTTIASDETFGARWLPDGRRVICLTGTTHPELVVVDSVTRKRSVVAVELPRQPTADVFSITRDGRTIYLGGEHEEADIWIAERK